MTDRLPVFPLETAVNAAGHLVVGGCDTVALAREFGTPLYVFDEKTLRAKCREFLTEFGDHYPEVKIIYASKAYSNAAILKIIKEEGLGLDVVSGGELGIARMAGFPMKKVYFHGNNKSREEIALALKYKVGIIVVDNFQELEMLDKMAREQGVNQDVLLRMTPGVNPQTHVYTSTGAVDSKFGFPLPLKEEAVIRALKTNNLNVLGLHFHIGSRITEIAPYLESVKFILKFAAEMRDKHQLDLKELNIGGGFDVKYTLAENPPTFGEFAEAITVAIKKECKKWNLPLPRLVVEPGREIVAQSAIALYEVGVIKDIPGLRTYVAVDGGMGDNIRPALYNARLEAVVANRMKARLRGKVTVCGKFCESGDVLIKDIELPAMKPGDILALNGAGAYALPESMNYNAFFKPPVLLVKDGQARMIRRRETLADITRCDI